LASARHNEIVALKLHQPVISLYQDPSHPIIMTFPHPSLPVAMDPEGNETVWMGDKVRGRERGGGRGGGREWREGERGGRGRERERDWGRERKWRDGGNGERGGNGEIEGGRERDHGPLIIVYSWSY
jgi:hypothetical protein